MFEIEKRIGAYIKTNGLKQNAVAEGIGMSQGMMWRICNGKKAITLQDYYRLCQFLRVPLEYFVEE